MTHAISNMAPKTIGEITSYVTFKHARPCLDLWNTVFAADTLSEDDKIAKFLKQTDREIFAWYQTLNPKPRTWRIFKNKFKQEAMHRSLIEMFKSKQKPNETLHEWLRKTLDILDGSWYDEEIIKTMLLESAYDSYARQQVDILCHKHQKAVHMIKELPEIEYRELLYKEDLQKEKERLTESRMKLKIITNKKKKEVHVKEKTYVPTIKYKEVKVNHIAIAEKHEKVIIEEQEMKVIVDEGSDVNILSEKLVEVFGLCTEKIAPITLKNFKGKITETNKQVKLTIAYKNIIITTDFLITECEDPDTILLGRETIEQVNRKQEALSKLNAQFSKLFDQGPCEGFPGYECPIETKPGKKVNIKYRSIPRAQEELVGRKIQELLDAGYIEPSTSS